MVTRRRVKCKISSIEELVLDNLCVQFHLLQCNVFSISPGSCVLEIISYCLHHFRYNLWRKRQAVKRRELTDIEIEIMRGVISSLLSEAEFMEQIVSINPEWWLLKAILNIYIAGPTDATSVASLSIKVAEYQGMLNICIPYANLEPILPKLSGVYSVGSVEVPEVDPEVFKCSAVSSARAACEAVLGQATLSIKDLLELGTGDVILLDKRPYEPITVEVEGKPRFVPTWQAW